MARADHIIVKKFNQKITFLNAFNLDVLIANTGHESWPEAGMSEPTWNDIHSYTKNIFIPRCSGTPCSIIVNPHFFLKGFSNSFQETRYRRVTTRGLRKKKKKIYSISATYFNEATISEDKNVAIEWSGWSSS